MIKGATEYDPRSRPYPLTSGNYETEAESEAAIDVFLDAACALGYWSVYREQPLYPVCEPSHRTKRVRYRADRLVVITSKMASLGWSRGDFVVEIKRSGERIGRPLCQLLDYKGAKAVSPSGRVLLPGCGFLFPCTSLYGPLGSISEQLLLGTANVGWCRETLAFSFGNSQAMWIERDGKVVVCAAGKGSSGKKGGNRG